MTILNDEALEECKGCMNECKQLDPVGRVTVCVQIAQVLDARKKKEWMQKCVDAILEEYKILRQYGFVLLEELSPMAAYVHEEG